ncbi:MAG TPA: hypothetical protein PKW35_08705, partial [Nannocystaceae bacterium]|nr:hypothetical protein [Nannocystaceae bacterium]
MSKATSPQLAPGTVIDGMYTIGESLRSRVGAVTYAATDPNDKKVEVTVYRPDCFMNPMALERSLRELRQVSTVDDPRVVHVFDSGKMKDGGVYEVHEHVDGKTIAELGAQSGEDASKILQEVVAALLAAGKAGVLHRDLGPDVVLRAADGAVKVGGFAVGEPQGGVSFGAIECIAPEQVEGKNIDEATLVYNLAALGYRILHGRAVFVGDVATQLLQHAASVPPADVDPALAPGLAKDPKSRPAGLAVFGGQIGRLASAPAKPAGGPIAKGGGFGPLPGAKPAGGAAKLPGLGAPPAAAAGRAPLGPLPGAP